MEFETLLIEINDGVAVLTLNRPEDANAINLQMGQDLLEAACECDRNPEIRAVILTGAGKMFCAGGDLLAMESFGEDIGGKIAEMATSCHSAIARFARMDAPMICAINGTAAGGGLGLALCGDIVISADTARFTMAYTAAGLSPDLASTYVLPRLIGLRRTQELALTNRILSAAEAADWGMVTSIVSPEDLIGEAEHLAATLAHGPTKSFGSVKRLLLKSFEHEIEAQMEFEAREISLNAAGADGREGIEAFLSKRKPSFNGHR